jgi:AraC-like DNA-binding protein
LPCVGSGIGQQLTTMTADFSRASEWYRYYHLAVPASVEALHARFVAHRYPRHMHDYYVVGLIESGTQTYWYRGARYFTQAGQIFFVNPEEMHTGEPASPCGYTYRTLYLRAKDLAQLAEDVRGRALIPHFTQAVVDDPTLAQLLGAFHRAIANDPGTLESEVLLLKALERLVAAHTEPRVVQKHLGRERPGVRRARDFLEEHFAQRVSLADLANIAALSLHHLARAFEREVGLPPHLYLEGIRIRHVRELLAGGVSPAQAALLAGYSDQSHLTRRFKRFMGIPPGAYVRERKIRQDPRH